MPCTHLPDEFNGNNVDACTRRNVFQQKNKKTEKYTPNVVLCTGEHERQNGEIKSEASAFGGLFSQQLANSPLFFLFALFLPSHTNTHFSDFSRFAMHTCLTANVRIQQLDGIFIQFNEPTMFVSCVSLHVTAYSTI